MLEELIVSDYQEILNTERNRDLNCKIFLIGLEEKLRKINEYRLEHYELFRCHSEPYFAKNNHFNIFLLSQLDSYFYRIHNLFLRDLIETIITKNTGIHNPETILNALIKRYGLDTKYVNWDSIILMNIPQAKMNKSKRQVIAQEASVIKISEQNQKELMLLIDEHINKLINSITKEGSGVIEQEQAEVLKNNLKTFFTTYNTGLHSFLKAEANSESWSDNIELSEEKKEYLKNDPIINSFIKVELLDNPGAKSVFNTWRTTLYKEIKGILKSKFMRKYWTAFFRKIMPTGNSFYSDYNHIAR
ncbi:hypothetical protein BXY85_3531 [Roseivirga pacifica]|uniref:Uncharacterized protein n=1 Tax=Roseivirga pacifica TaxID=1267423 RepID=A0A1I0QHB8_9BACT|nr:hypothetical protein [Roseivirga pacifica]RKQ42914.1 hypothetical protein BXY85_3531 [Roseivirga pacifica]SEW26473.1 hypothetical protein SAMN05216290_2344 [Roseivirga pacifica]